MPVNFLWQAWHMKIYSNSCVRYLCIACISSGHCADVGVLCGAVLLRAHEHVVHGDSVLGRLVQSIDNHVGWREWITRTGGKPLQYSNQSQSFNSNILGDSDEDGKRNRLICSHIMVRYNIPTRCYVTDNDN